MRMRNSARAVAGVAGLVLSSVLAVGAVSVSRPSGLAAVSPEVQPWAVHLVAMDGALAAGDVPAALKAWHDAYGAALGGRRWEGFAAAGDAYLRLARASGAADGGRPRARELYLSALFRARDAGSIDGVLRVAAAFERLGDHEVATQALTMARRMAAARLTSVDEYTPAPAG